jgi:perosamine synthetase
MASILQGERWSEGDYLAEFEHELGAMHDAGAVVMSSWSGAALACFEYYGLQGKRVLCPTNTFMATPLAIRRSGAEVVFADCKREDLCLSIEAVERGIRSGVTAVVVVHIGGHIAFDIDAIVSLCRSNGVLLIEDCAHAIGSTWNGKLAGTFGDASIFSLYSTKTISTGEGGFLCSSDAALLEFARAFRNYGKPHYAVNGMNFRMDEFRAALGIVQLARLPEIIEWKNAFAREHLDSKYKDRVHLPDGMISNYYKYIVFEQVEESSGRVYDTLCHSSMDSAGSFPNAEWITSHHSCVPLYYDPLLAK